MEEDGAKRHRFKKRSRSVDWISSLPDCLLCQILSNLPTKEAVKTSTLSKRWRSLWKHVPSLDLANLDFPDLNTLSTFVDSFLDFNSFLHEFKLNYGFRTGEDDPETEKKIDLITRWINTVVMTREAKHVQVTDDADGNWELEMPTTLYACESLVSLNLSGVTLPSVKHVSLPCLKAIYLNSVTFDDGLALEMLISRCPVLESLGIEKTYCAQVLRVRSESLLRFTHFSEYIDNELVEVDAPRLEYLRIIDHGVESFVVKNVTSSLVEVDIDNLSMDKSFDHPNDLQKKRNVIRGFLAGISRVKNMTIASRTLEVIYDYSRCEPLPLFRNLTFLRVEFDGHVWEMLPVFLESCPNLKSLVVGSTSYRENYGARILFQPQCFLSCLEYVKIERPLEGEANQATEMKLVSYLLGNSTILKKLTLFLDVSMKAEESAVLKELLTIPRLSSSCQVVVL